MKGTSFHELHKRLEQAKTADEAREIAQEYAGYLGEGYGYSHDDRALMHSFINAVCRCNGTHWTDEIIYAPQSVADETADAMRVVKRNFAEIESTADANLEDEIDHRENATTRALYALGRQQ